MKIKLFTVALGLALTATAITATAQKSINTGIITLSTQMRGMDVEAKNYFTPDSTATTFSMMGAEVKVLLSAKGSFMAVALDISAMGMKKAGVATPAEYEAMVGSLPTFTFAPTTETQTISGFACKKVVATEAKSGKKYDLWITNDVTVGPTALPFYYNKVGGFPVKYTSFQQGQEATVTVKSVTEGKAPAGTFAIGKDFEKSSMEEFNASMGGGR